MKEQKKKYLFFIPKFPKGDDSYLHKDFIKKVSEEEDVYVMVPLERREKLDTHMYIENNIKIIFVRTFNMFNNVNKLEKITSILITPFLMKRAIKKYLNNIKFDYVVGYTPHNANANLIKFIKKQYKSKFLLFLYDIFPQNAWDLGLIKNKSIFKYFKYKEQKIFELADKIYPNCNQGVNYLLDNKYKDKNSVILIRNSEYIENEEIKTSRYEIEKKYNLDPKDLICIFGGNMGIPQKLENILKIAKFFEEKNIKFFFIGDGSELIKLKKIVKEQKISNVIFIKNLIRTEYEKILDSCDIGIISLNENYTVPNFPTKVTGYIKKGIPIFASLDESSYKGLGKFIIENNIGQIGKANDFQDLVKNFKIIINDLKIYKKNTKEFLKIYEENFDINKNYLKFKNSLNEI